MFSAQLRYDTRDVIVRTEHRRLKVGVPLGSTFRRRGSSARQVLKGGGTVGFKDLLSSGVLGKSRGVTVAE